jgi:hypothetical protein
MKHLTQGSAGMMSFEDSHCGEWQGLLENGKPRGRRLSTLVILATGAATVAGTCLLLGRRGSSASAVLMSGPPLSLGTEAAGSDQPRNRAQLIAMAERAVEKLVQHMADDRKHFSGTRPARAARGRSGLHVANTPILAASTNDVVVGGRHFVRSQMLSAIDSFFESDNNKLLVAQAIEEEALEVENGGQGEGTEVMAADALERLESGDTEFENEWANAGEKVVATSSANRATHATYKYMIERDLGHARDEFDAAEAEADAEMEKLQQEKAALAAAEAAVAAANQAAEESSAALETADVNIAAAEAAQAALDEQAESDAQLVASCPDLEAALATAGTAGQHFTDSLELVVDATGDSSTTVQDVAAIGTAAEDVAATEGTVASARAACLAQMGMPADDTGAVVPSALTIEVANAAKEEAEAANTAAAAAVTEKEAQKAAAEAAVAEQQALYDEKKEIKDGKQGIMDKLLEAHKSLACDPHKLAHVEPYTIDMQEAGACEFPANDSRVQYAITQAEKAAEEARNRAEIEGLVADKAWWQTALEELGDARPAIDKAQEAWDEAKAMKEAEAGA